MTDVKKLPGSTQSSASGAPKEKPKKTTADDKIVAKGIYRHTCLEHYVAPKQYIFVRRDGVKHLIVRYSNDTESTLDTISIVLTELNADGTVIKTRKLKHKNVGAEPGKSFSPHEGIPISDACVDFKIKVLEARSGKYVYRSRGGEVFVYYEPKSEKTKKSERNQQEDIKVTRRGVSHSMLMASLTSFAMLVVMACCVLMSVYGGDVFNFLHDLIVRTGDIISDFFENLGGFLSNLFENIGELLGNLFDYLGDLLSGIPDLIDDFMQGFDNF